VNFVSCGRDTAEGTSDKDIIGINEDDTKNESQESKRKQNIPKKKKRKRNKKPQASGVAKVLGGR
jgi:hypothetical protein